MTTLPTIYVNRFSVGADANWLKIGFAEWISPTEDAPRFAMIMTRADAIELTGLIGRMLMESDADRRVVPADHPPADELPLSRQRRRKK